METEDSPAMRMTPLRPTLATALAAFLALLSVSVVGGIVAGSGPFCGYMGGSRGMS
jgi:hypothetical protein